MIDFDTAKPSHKKMLTYFRIVKRSFWRHNLAIAGRSPRDFDVFEKRTG